MTVELNDGNVIMFKGSKGQKKAKNINIPLLSWQGPKYIVCTGCAWTENRGDDSQSGSHCEYDE